MVSSTFSWVKLTCLVIVVQLCGHYHSVYGFMVENDTAALMYLERFGYIDQQDMDPLMGMKEALPMLMAFQKMCGIDQSGQLDNKTVEMMNTPRCGNKDMKRVPLEGPNINENDPSDPTSYSYGNRLRRYTINESKQKWRKREVTYRMGMFSNEMQKHVTEKDVLEAIHKAFRMWSEVTNLDFFHRPEDKQVDIELSFTTRFHMQDGFPFDGPGKVLAHAFPPGGGIGGDVHFEDEEEWRVHSPKGTDVLFVAVHEIGHALGLSHSSTKGAIMAAFYAGYKPQLKLHPDDIEGIQAIYGKREASPQQTQAPTPKPTKLPPPPPPRKTTRLPPPPPPPKTTKWTPPPTPPPTPTTRIFYPKPVPTTATTIRDFLLPRITTTSFTKWPINKWEDNSAGSGKFTKPPPQRTSQGRPDLCQDSRIDAITTLNDGGIYAFKGAYAFKLGTSGEGILPGWPNHIGFVFPGLETELDAVATRENGKTYFFKGAKYWRFSGTRMDPGYPKLITQHFLGVPDNLDAAFVWLGQFYFVKGDKFWRFNPKKKPHVDPIYPISTDRWNIPYGLDAAFRAPNKEIYFFKGSEYYKLDQGKFKTVDNASPPYPRPTARFWLGCTPRPNLKPSDRDIRNDDDFESDYLYNN